MSIYLPGAEPFQVGVCISFARDSREWIDLQGKINRGFSSPS